MRHTQRTRRSLRFQKRSIRNNPTQSDASHFISRAVYCAIGTLKLKNTAMSGPKCDIQKIYCTLVLNILDQIVPTLATNLFQQHPEPITQETMHYDNRIKPARF